MRKVCATGAGSASPVVSMMMPSNFATLAYNLFNVVTRSPRTVLVKPSRDPRKKEKEKEREGSEDKN